MAKKHYPYAELEITFLRPEEGGRTPPPLLDLEFADGPDGPAPVAVPIGATVRFMYEPAVDYSALEVGALIEVVEGTRVDELSGLTTVQPTIVAQRAVGNGGTFSLSEFQLDPLPRLRLRRSHPS